MGYHQKLQDYFKSKGLKQVDVAKRIGYTKNMISKYLKTNKPNYQFIIAVQEEFPDIDWNYLFKEKNTVENNSLEHKKNATQLINEIEERVVLLKEWHKKDTNQN
ncbi:helix-turn-helix domain-containing protein [Tenacibaculum soleae]|uniref:helix-turn-helix domain-containing protein n=1 Tax=Tenacibaculum soleae TaxID=447689 RepID=UPI0023016691|nr:helix-turn-helix transcriptional regulator [Tenacibaculum soleae]